jgi:HK97 family phage major capsid protein
MFDTKIDLDAYRGVEELQRLAHDVQDELAAMERESNGAKFTDDERAKFAGLHQTKKDIGKRIGELRARQRMLLENAAHPGRVERPEDAYYPTRDSVAALRLDEPRHISESRDAGLRAIDQHSGLLTNRAGERLEGALRSDHTGVGGRYLAAVANPHYSSAFGKMIADPNSGHLRFTPAEVEAARVAAQAEEQRNLNVTTGSAGQFAIPFALDPSIILTSTGVLNPLRNLGRVETIVGATTWKGVASDGVVAAFGAEGAVATDASPTLVQPSITVQKAFCFVPFTIEASQDWGGLQQELVVLMNDAKNILEATKFLLGSGTNEPGGILNIGGTGGLTTTQRVQTATSATYAVADPWALKAALPPRFIPATTYAAGPAIWDKTYRFVAQGSTTEPRQFGDGDRGGDFLGAPKEELSTFVVTTTTGSKIMVAGDFNTGYRIVDRIGGTAELIPHLFGAAQGNLPVGMRGLYYYFRVGGGVVAPNALRYLEVL